MLKLLEKYFPYEGDNQVAVDKVCYANVLKIAGCLDYSTGQFEDSLMKFYYANEEFEELGKTNMGKLLCLLG